MIKLDSCHINNFKSLDDFDLEFSKFTCLIGLNSSGKSTILQAIDFISAQMKGDISAWLNSRNWEAKELNCKFSDNTDIVMYIHFFYNTKLYVWSLIFNPNDKKTISEDIASYFKGQRDYIFKVEHSTYMIDKDGDIKEGDIIQDYEGSFLAKLKPELLPEVIVEFRKYLQNIHSLDLLSPRELKKESKDKLTLGLSGENLSSFLRGFDETHKANILKNLQKCYPNIEDYAINPTANGYYKLDVTEKFNGKTIINEAKYLNDGILRLIAIFGQLETPNSFLLFDEIENGINSELIEYLMDILIASKHQIIITTHSPMILNYIDESVAKESIKYIYKTKNGLTRTIPFCIIPSMAEKLEYMGVGSAYVDTDLDELVDEIEDMWCI